MKNKSCMEFIHVLASKEPVPGGGGASALTGAIGTALCTMVGNLTLGKKKYADVQADIENMIKKTSLLAADFLTLIEKDAQAFEPLSKAYGLPRETEEQKLERDTVMESALRTASDVPYEIMEKCAEAIDLLAEMGEKGTRIALSDVGVGAALCKAALCGASLNIFINTGFMKDREYTAQTEAKTDALLSRYGKKADEVYTAVVNAVRK